MAAVQGTTFHRPLLSAANHTYPPTPLADVCKLNVAVG